MTPSLPLSEKAVPHAAFPQAVLDESWHLISVNPAWVQLTGNTLGWSWLDLIHPTDLARDLALSGAVQSGQRATYQTTTRIHLANGSWSAVALTVTILPEAIPDVPTHRVLVTLDDHPGSSTDCHSMVLGTQALADVHCVSAALSHDVKQHARLASAYCSLLARGSLDERQRSLVAVIADQTDRLQHLLSGLVHWLRLIDEHWDNQDCDLDGIWLKATHDLAFDLIPDPTSEAMPIISGNPELLTELFRELALNAVRYHVARPRITLRVSHDLEFWNIDISDDGPGIPKDQREAVLRPLQRLHRWEEVPGHGMGLALASRIANRHGGTLEILANDGAGCTVHLCLPRNKATK